MPHTHRSTSRFALDIQAIPALKEITKFPIISDPSHASFWAPWVPSLTYANLLDVNVCESQLLKVLESHIKPKKVIKKLRVLKDKFGDKSLSRLSKN